MLLCFQQHGNYTFKSFPDGLRKAFSFGITSFDFFLAVCSYSANRILSFIFERLFSPPPPPPIILHAFQDVWYLVKMDSDDVPRFYELGCDALEI